MVSISMPTLRLRALVFPYAVIAFGVFQNLHKRLGFGLQVPSLIKKQLIAVAVTAI